MEFPNHMAVHFLSLALSERNLCALIFQKKKKKKPKKTKPNIQAQQNSNLLDIIERAFSCFQLGWS